MSFLSILENLHSRGPNETIPECQTEIPTSSFHYYLMIPSVLMIATLGCTLPRKNTFLDYLQGRPGTVFPMDILSKRHRFYYAAAWGSISFLACDLVLGVNNVVNLQGPSYVTVFNKILSMVVIGVDYFPLFASLSVESITGYVIGTTYVWVFLTVQLIRDFECELDAAYRTIYVFRDLPNIICLGYLSISLPIRVIQSVRHNSLPLFSTSEQPSNLNLDQELDSSAEAHHVRDLFRPDPLPPPPPVTKKDKLIDVTKGLLNDYLYERKQHFRYSARVVSVMLMGLMVIYKVTLESTVAVVGRFANIDNVFRDKFDDIGWEPVPGEDPSTTDLRVTLNAWRYRFHSFRACFIVAVVFACIGSILTILHMLSSYRTNLFSLYKGDNTHIPHRSTRSNPSLLIGSMKYAGYQVAYTVWGCVLHFILLFLIAVVLCFVIIWLKAGHYQWLLDLLAASWPAVVMAIAVIVVQMLLAKFAFLHENGELLAIDNRRMFFSFTFFMFFYNIFIGLLSCLMRIIKSIVFGAIFLPRLDNSALPRRIQMLDPGFVNYCGFMHVECYHTHPVMLMFLRILMRDLKKTKEKKVHDSDTGVTMDEIAAVEVETQDSQPSDAHKKAKCRWLLVYTLLNNPTLRVYRKAYMKYMKDVQERLAREYHLKTEAAGRIVSQMNQTFIVDDPTAEDTGTSINGILTPMRRKSNNVMVMNRFMNLLKTEMNKGDTKSTTDGTEQVNNTK